jgi:opacity protein-like surface antigen
MNTHNVQIRRASPLHWAVCAMVLMAIPVPASANRARINALGGGEKRFTIVDSQNIWRLPSELVHHGSQALLETAGEDYTAFGVHLNLSPETVLAIYGSSEGRSVLSEPRATAWSGLFENIYLGKDAFANQGDGVTHKGTAFLATSLGDWGRLGVRFGIWSDTERDALDSQDLNSRGPFVVDFGVGLGFEVGGGSVDTGLGFSFASSALQCYPLEEGGCDVVSDGTEMRDLTQGLEFHGDGLIRGRWSLGDMLTIIPYIDASYRTTTLDGVSVPDTIAIEAKRLSMAVGVDLAVSIGEGLTIQPGLELEYMTWEDSLTTPMVPEIWPPAVGDPSIHIPALAATEFHVPSVSLAVEWRPMDWLAVRGGGAVTVAMTSNTTDNYTLSEDGVPETIVQTTEDDTEIRYRFGGGLGFSLPHGVELDLEMQYGQWESGPYISLPQPVDGLGANVALRARW